MHSDRRRLGSDGRKTIGADKDLVRLFASATCLSADSIDLAIDVPCHHRCIILNMVHDSLSCELGAQRLIDAGNCGNYNTVIRVYIFFPDKVIQLAKYL